MRLGMTKKAREILVSEQCMAQLFELNGAKFDINGFMFFKVANGYVYSLVRKASWIFLGALWAILSNAFCRHRVPCKRRVMPTNQAIASRARSSNPRFPTMALGVSQALGLFSNNLYPPRSYQCCRDAFTIKSLAGYLFLGRLPFSPRRSCSRWSLIEKPGYIQMPNNLFYEDIFDISHEIKACICCFWFLSQKMAQDLWIQLFETMLYNLKRDWQTRRMEVPSWMSCCYIPHPGWLRR